jgi:hypothetical protein
MMEISKRNLLKLIGGAKKGMAAGIILMIEDGDLFTLATRAEYMHMTRRRNRLESCARNKTLLGVFKPEFREGAFDFFCRLWEEALAAEAPLPERPSFAFFSTLIKARTPERALLVSGRQNQNKRILDRGSESDHGGDPPTPSAHAGQLAAA